MRSDGSRDTSTEARLIRRASTFSRRLARGRSRGLGPKNGVRFVWLCLSVLLLAGCPYDKFYGPRLKNNINLPVETRIVLTDGTVIDDGVGLAPGVGLVWGYPPESIAKISLVAGGRVIDEIDAQRIAEMLRCTPDPRDVTWYIESAGLRPSVTCRPTEPEAR